jgi:hypothetical protein
MLARYRRATDLPIHTALSGGERQAVRVRRLSVNLQGATLGIPGNWQPDVLPGHDRLDGSDLSPQGPHAECGITVTGDLQGHGHGATACGFSGLRHQSRRSMY